MKKIDQNSRLYSFIMLMAGALFLLFTGGRFNYWLAPWFSGIFYIRYFRKGKLVCRYFSAVLVTWIVTLISWHGIQPLDSISYTITMLITTFISVLPYIGDRLLYKKVPPFASTLVFPVFATFIEYIFISGNPMGSFGSLAYSQFDNSLFIQMASITGITGLTFVISWFSSVINHLWEKQSRKPSVVFACLLLGIYIFGAFSYFNESETETVNVAGIFKAHPEITLPAIMSADESKRYEMANELIESYLEETRNLAEAGYSVISWSEAAVVTKSIEFKEWENHFSILADDLNIYLIVPYMVINENSPAENRLKMYSPEGKTSLEHIKYGGNIFEGSLEGDGQIAFAETEFGKISSVICWDMDFPDKVSQTGKNGVDLLFSPSHEWEKIIPVHAQMAVFRGIENGSSTIHPASMGLSVIADSRGRIMAEENWYDSEKKSITGSVPVKGTKTVYSLMGDLFPLLIMISTALLIIYSIIFVLIRFKKKRADKGGLK